MPERRKARDFLEGAAMAVLEALRPDYATWWGRNRASGVKQRQQ